MSLDILEALSGGSGQQKPHVKSAEDWRTVYTHSKGLSTSPTDAVLWKRGGGEWGLPHRSTAPSHWEIGTLMPKGRRVSCVFTAEVNTG